MNTVSKETRRNDSNDMLVSKVTILEKNKSQTPRKANKWKEEYRKIKEQKLRESQMNKAMGVSP